PRNATSSAGRSRRGASPLQYSDRRSSSVQSPDSSAATGPGWNQLRVSVGGEKCSSPANTSVPVCSTMAKPRNSRSPPSPYPCAVVVRSAGGRPAAGGGAGAPGAGDGAPGEGERGGPGGGRRRGAARFLLGGRAVRHPGQRPGVVVHLGQKVGLGPAGEVEEP